VQQGYFNKVILIQNLFIAILVYEKNI